MSGRPQFAWQLAIALPLFGTTLIGISIASLNESHEANRPPRVISCRQFEDLDPARLHSVVLTDARPAKDGYVYHERHPGLGWDWVLIPLYSADIDGPPNPADFRIILQLHGVRNDQDVWQALNSPQLKAVVSRSAGRLLAPDKALLDHYYPGINFDRCWILTAGTAPSSALVVWGLGAAGIGSWVAGLFAMYAVWTTWSRYRRRTALDRQADQFGPGTPAFDRTF
jgi:hypothetical protein